MSCAERTKWVSDTATSLVRRDAHGLIGSGPRSPLPGAPSTYVTTPALLSLFGLGSSRDLPEIEVLQDAGLLDRATLNNHPHQCNYPRVRGLWEIARPPLAGERFV